jgi:hypothetical protein
MCAGVAELREEEIHALDVQGSGCHAGEPAGKRKPGESRDQGQMTTSAKDMRTFIPEKYWESEKVFTKSTFDSLPVHTSYDHAINLDESFMLRQSKLYPLSPREQKALEEFIAENLRTRRIHTSKSPQAAPFFFRKKGEEVNAPDVDPGLRPIQDYQYLNAHTVWDRYPLPLLSEILHAPKLQTVKCFTVVDIRWGFNNIWIREGDEWKAAFITNHGLFKPLVKFFGMCNVPVSFQWMADTILQPLIDQGCIFVYVDDMLIAGDTLQELDHWMQEVLTVMRDANLSCKPVKCQFE